MQGKEHEWLFSAEEGQAQLADMTNFKRLIIASMQRLHHYQSMDEVTRFNVAIGQLVESDFEFNRSRLSYQLK